MIWAPLCFIGLLWANLRLQNARLRAWAGRFLLPFFIALLFAIGPHLSATERLVFSTALLLGVIKTLVLLKRSAREICDFSRVGLALYAFVWPGVEARPFEKRGRNDWSQSAPRELTRALFHGAACLVLGIASLGALAWNAPLLNREFLGWATIFALLLTVHFGIGEALPYFFTRLGFEVKRLFRAPLQSVSLSDFWSRRWNLAFVEMDALLFLRPLRKRFGARGAVFGVFVLSGVFHEIGISYPAGAGWGGPLFYFLLHGVLVVGVAPKIRSVLASRVLTWAAILIPLPLLFHGPFRESLILPFVFWASEILHQKPFDFYFSLALWLGSLAHFCILGASFQVPKRLGWREDFATLSRFNQKIFWTYGAFIVLCIVSFGVLTLFLHPELLRGEKGAVALAVFIGVFWAARVGVDLFYFGHDDWPKGLAFEVGHVFLTLVFVLLAILFGVVVPLRAWFLASGLVM